MNRDTFEAFRTELLNVMAFIIARPHNKEDMAAASRLYNSLLKYDKEDLERLYNKMGRGG